MNKLKILLVPVLVAPLLVAGTVHADEDPMQNDEQTVTTQNETTTSSRIKTGNEGLTMQQRVDRHKAAAKIRLATGEKIRIQGRCKAAQGKVGEVKGRLPNVQMRRDRAYANLVSHLESLTAKVKAKGVDTTTLETQITELKAKITTFQTDMAKYQEAAGDLAAMDCAADPEAFKASLEAARTLRAQLFTDAKAIRAYVADSIKPTLKTIRQQLETAAANTDTMNEEEEQ